LRKLCGIHPGDVVGGNHKHIIGACTTQCC
jgi:hypothetical protein